MGVSIGILGFGYLGQELVNVLGPAQRVWVTRQQPATADRSESSPLSVEFRWNDRESWKNLPDGDSILIITIPPCHDDVSVEQRHLSDWCHWLRQNRPDVKRCIYISSTGVYPNQPGNWTEQSRFQCDSLKGELRHISENVLTEQLNTRVIRPGAIYGNDRNIGRRILAGKPIPKGQQPVHRIHVHDLARLTIQAAWEECFPDLVNAVDRESETTKNVANWLLEQPFFPKKETTSVDYQSEFRTRKFNLTQPDRKISNRRLVNECGFEFVYPTYQEGLQAAFGKPT